MTSLFPDLRADLLGAMERGPRRRRAPVVAAVAVLVAAAVVAGVTRIDRGARPVATPTPAPVDVSSLPPSIQTTMSAKGSFGRKPGTPMLALRPDDGAVAWTMVVYISRGGMISETVAPDRLHQEFAGVGGSTAFAYADSGLDNVNVGIGVQGVRLGGTRHYLIGGTVDASVRAVTITVGGRRVETRLSPGSITLPVEIPKTGLTAEG